VKSFLAQRWFLLALVASVTCALAVPSVVAPITGPLPPHLVVASALFIMAWTMPSRPLKSELARPWAAGWAIAVSYVFLPTVAWLAGALSPTPDLRVGLLLAASVPCTLASCVLWTRMAGGNEATALVAVLGCTFASWLVTPLWLAATTASHIELDRTEMMRSLAATLVVPVIAGQVVRLWPFARSFADRRKSLLSGLAQIFVLAIVLKTAAQVGTRLHAGAAALSAPNLILSAGLAMATHIAALFFGYYSSHALGIDRPRRIAIAFSGSQKTLPVSVFLFDAYFQADFPLAVIPLLFFHVGQLLFDTMVSSHFALSREPSG
jgi:sodium/bile acid cotransporter 7